MTVGPAGVRLEDIDVTRFRLESKEGESARAGQQGLLLYDGGTVCYPWVDDFDQQQLLELVAKGQGDRVRDGWYTYQNQIISSITTNDDFKKILALGNVTNTAQTLCSLMGYEGGARFARRRHLDWPAERPDISIRGLSCARQNWETCKVSHLHQCDHSFDLFLTCG